MCATTPHTHVHPKATLWLGLQVRTFSLKQKIGIHRQIRENCERFLLHWSEMNWALSSQLPIVGSAADKTSCSHAPAHVYSSRTQDTGHRTQDTGHRTQDTGHRTQDTGHRTQDTGHRTQDTGHRTQDTGHRTQDTGHRTQDSGIRNQDTGHRTQDTGHRTQDSEYKRKVHAQIGSKCSHSIHAYMFV